MSLFEDKIKSSGMRLTKPRKRLIALLESAERPMSAEEIVNFDEEGSLDLVTIYRNMAVFCQQGFAQVIQLENGKQLFEIKRGEGDHHHHIVCRRCHHVVKLDLCFGNEFEKYAYELGYRDVTHTFEIFGTCADCAKTTTAGQG